MKRLLGPIVASLFGIAGCRTQSAVPVDAPLESRGETHLPPLSFTGNWTADQVNNSLWSSALDGDEWAALELARTEGPRGLLSQLGHGGPGARAAALAWPFVPTAWAFRGQWCQQAARYGAGEWPTLLRALGESVATRDLVGEELEPETLGHCGRLLSLAERHVASGDQGSGAIRDAWEAARAALAVGIVASKP